MKNKLLVCALLVVLLLSSMLCISCDDILGNLFLSEVTVTLDPNGGEGVDELTLVGKSGKSMTLPVPTRAGCTFDAWYSGYDAVSQTEFPDADVTLTARYYLNKDEEVELNFTTDENES